MEIKLKNRRQERIADLLWACETEDEVERVVKIFGKDAVTIVELMRLEYLDMQSEEAETDVSVLLKKIAKGA